MRGTVPINIVVPTKGLVRNVPNFQAPPDSLVDGLNVYVDEDGLMKTRRGYGLVGTLFPAERVLGILGYRDQNGTFQQVVGTPLRWQKYNDDGTFTDISGGTLLNGDADDCVRFTPFAQGGKVWVYGVNNNDVLYGWNSSLAAYIPIVGGVAVPITNIVGNGTSALATLPANPLGIKIGDSVVITGNTQGGFNTTVTVTLVGLNTFSFNSAVNATGTGGTASDTNGGAPFTAARDITVLANRVVVVNTVEGGTRNSWRVRWSAVNDGQTWPALGFNDMLDSNDAIVGIVRTSRVSAIIYRDLSAWLVSAYPGNDASAFTTERISQVDNMTGPCGPNAIAIAEGYHFYLGQDGRVYQYDGNTIQPISDPIDPVVRPLLNTNVSDRTTATYLPDKRSVVFNFPSQGSSDPATSIMYSIRRQAFEPLHQYPVGMTAAAVVEDTNGVTWNNWVPIGTTWSTISYATWNDIPASNSLDCWTGDPNGNVYRFFTASSDNGVLIGYFAQWPPVRQDPLKEQKMSDVELYLQQSLDPEDLAFVIWGLLQPLDNPGFAIAAVAIQLDDARTFSVPIQPGPNNPQNTGANFLQFKLTSHCGQAEMVFAGGTIFVDLDDRRTGYGVT